jgi:hypothetical protein
MAVNYKSIAKKLKFEGRALLMVNMLMPLMEISLKQ